MRNDIRIKRKEEKKKRGKKVRKLQAELLFNADKIEKQNHAKKNE